MNRNRSNRGFDNFRFEIFLHKFLRGHRQGTDEVEHVLATREAQIRVPIPASPNPSLSVEVHRQARHDRGIGCLKNLRGLVHKADKFSASAPRPFRRSV